MLQKNKNWRIFLPLVCLLVLYGCNTASTPRDIFTPVPHATDMPDPVKAPKSVAVVPSVEPETVDPEATEPEVVEPETVKPETVEPEPVETETVETEPVETETVETEPVETETAVAIAVPLEEPVESEVTLPGTHILLSGSASAYREIADQLNRTLERPSSVHTLTGVDSSDAEIIKSIQRSVDSQVVAVGLRAARAARKLDSKRVVFCQVVNYSDYDLVSENMKGVSALPSPRKLFDDWKTLSPQLDRVLVVSGKGFDDFMAVARDAAASRGITLIHRVVSNDREFLYAVKRNKEPVQGHWLLADNRVLSVKALKDVMAFNSKAAIQTVVFQSELLDFGGLFYVMPSSPEISDKVISRLNTSQSDIEVSGEDILLLDDHLMGINSQVAKQLGLEIPDHLKASIHDQ